MRRAATRNIETAASAEALKKARPRGLAFPNDTRQFCFLPGTSGSGFLFVVGFGFEPLVTPVAWLPEPVVPDAAEPALPVAFRLLLGEAPFAGTSGSVFV